MYYTNSKFQEFPIHEDILCFLFLCNIYNASFSHTGFCSIKRVHKLKEKYFLDRSRVRENFDLIRIEMSWHIAKLTKLWMKPN